MQFEGQQKLDQGNQDQVNIAVTKQEEAGDEPGEEEGDGSYYEDEHLEDQPMIANYSEMAEQDSL